MRPYRILLVGAVFAGMLVGCGPTARDPKVAHVLSVRQTGKAIAPVTAKFGPLSVEEAYKVQDGLTAALADEGRKVVGYKIAFAGAGAQRAWGLDEPAYGRFYTGQRIADGGTVDLADYHTFHFEVEVAFVLAKRIDKPITDIADLRPYVRSVHAGFDLPSNRFDGDLGPRKIADVIADGAAANRFVLGPARDPDKIELDKLAITGTLNGKEVYAGPTSNVMGNPWKALGWLSNTLLRRGFALEAGDVVLSGAVTKMYTPPAGKTAGTYVGDCGALGRVSCKVVGALK